MKEENGVEYFNLENFALPDIPDFNTQDAISHFKNMYKIRLMESYMNDAYKKDRIRGFCHLVIGQECLYSALSYVLKNNEKSKLICSYRCHAAGFASGCTIKEIVAESLGLSEGNCKGKGGSMHLYNNRFYGGHGIVGAQVPLANGIAYSIKYQNFIKNMKSANDNKSIENTKIDFLNHPSDSVCFCIYGDGASNQGQVYESFNMAKLYRLPIVYIVENNQYGMYTPIINVSVDDCFYKRGYLIPGIRVSDKNAFRLTAILRFAEIFAMKNGPIIVQVDTYRICGHSTIDKTQDYKSKKEQNEAINNDYFEILKREILDKISQEDFNVLEEEVRKEFNSEIDGINLDLIPGKQDLFTDVYFN